MENSSRWLSSVSDWLNEQEWFQELKGKWESLDPQSRIYLQFAGVGAVVLLFFYLVFSGIWGVQSLKHEISEKNDLLTKIQAANDELTKLRESQPSGAGNAGDNSGPWGTYMETTAGAAGIDKSSLTISDEKPGNTTDLAKEVLFDITLKHVSIKQIVRYAFSLENGSRPMKLRNLSIDTHADPAGYMDATLSVSGFSLINPNK
jgi:hypothetical protein